MKPDLFFSIVATIDMSQLADKQKVDAIVNLIRQHVQMMQGQLDLLDLHPSFGCSFQVDGCDPINILLKDYKLK